MKRNEQIKRKEEQVSALMAKRSLFEGQAYVAKIKAEIAKKKWWYSYRELMDLRTKEEKYKHIKKGL